MTIDNNEMQKQKKKKKFSFFFCTQIFVFHLLLSFVVCLVSMVSIHHSFMFFFVTFIQLSHTFVGIQEITNLKMTSDKQNKKKTTKIVLLMDRHYGVAKRLFL